MQQMLRTKEKEGAHKGLENCGIKCTHNEASDASTNQFNFFSLPSLNKILDPFPIIVFIFLHFNIEVKTIAWYYSTKTNVRMNHLFTRPLQALKKKKEKENRPLQAMLQGHSQAQQQPHKFHGSRNPSPLYSNLMLLLQIRVIYNTVIY